MAVTRPPALLYTQVTFYTRWRSWLSLDAPSPRPLLLPPSSRQIYRAPTASLVSDLVLTGRRSQPDTERHSATLFRVTNPTLILLPDIGMF